MKKIIFFICFLTLITYKPVAQTIFTGSFIMSFQKSDSIKDYPMLWYIKLPKDGGSMAMEIQDEMKLKGVSKRILFNPADSTWMMLMEYNKVKQGTVIHAAAMYRDTVKEKKLIIKNTKFKKDIEGFTCRKVIIESTDNYAEAWITKQLNFNLCNVYKLLSHCGMMSAYVRKGDWYFSKKIDGMILELTSKNFKTGETYAFQLTGIKPGETNSKFFDTTGFRISEIPEGQNCGVTIEK